MRNINEYAKKTFLAMHNPLRSVKNVFPNIIDDAVIGEKYYLGVKNTQDIPEQFLDYLTIQGFLTHTIDQSSIGGRAIDVSLKNPFTGNPMTGSSSGTALNVLLGINDIGLGTDGGGSVLAPAMSVNLYSFISPLLGAEYNYKKKKKMSTDGLAFFPSLGFITKDFSVLEQCIRACLDFSKQDLGLMRKADSKINVITDFADDLSQIQNQHNVYQVSTIDLSGKASKSREMLMKDLQQMMEQANIVISKEGPIDLYGLGDTVLGHFDANTLANQNKGNKGFLKVVNMLGYTALSVPTKEFATSRLLICRSSYQDIANLMSLARLLMIDRDILTERYFANYNAYFENGISTL